MFRILVAVMVIFMSVQGGLAQDRVFVQIAARPTIDQALADLRGYSRDLQGLGGYRLRNGWYAIALGPFDPQTGQGELAALIASGRAPADSFLAQPHSFRRQFWPSGAASLAGDAPLLASGFSGAQANTTPNRQTEEDPAPAPRETPAQARASERLLDRTAREDLQRALAWFGHYTSAIDGAIGPGSRAAMAQWQVASGHPRTGILTTSERGELLAAFRGEMQALGLAQVRDEAAGIVIDMPSGLVEFSRVQAPFVHYQGSGENPARVILISQAGDRARLAALFEVMQTLDIVPTDASARFRRESFVIDGQNAEGSTHVEAHLGSDGIKGFALVWPRDHPGNATRIAQAMRAGFAPLEGQVLPEDAGIDAQQDVDLMAGLRIRRPQSVRSGVFVGATGSALTVGAFETCDSVTIDDLAAQVRPLPGGHDLSLVTPREGAVPLGVADFGVSEPRIGGNIAVAGYAFDGRLDAATVTYGTLADIRGFDGESDVARLALNRHHGGAGGPVLDTTGSLIGILEPAEVGLPDTTRTAISSSVLAGILSAAGYPPNLGGGGALLAPEDLNILAADITARIACWTD